MGPQSQHLKVLSAEIRLEAPGGRVCPAQSLLAAFGRGVEELGLLSAAGLAPHSLASLTAVYRHVPAIQ